MKRTLIIATLLLAGIVIDASPAGAQVSISISFGDFYGALSPYGEWVYVDQDVYAWRPGRIMHGWMPYTYGRWVWSAYGWYWVSEEPWSWAVYHYGRWHFDDYYGWIWIPGYDWAPAWVEWRYGTDYVGWAPLGPYALWGAHRGVYYSQAYRAPYDHWTFVAYGSMTRQDVYRYRYRGDDIQRVYGSSRYTGSVRYRNGVAESRGPDREYVERRGNVRIGTADVVDVNDYSRVRASRKGDRERIEVYRPRVTHEEAGRAVRPDRVTRTERTPSIDSRYLDARLRPEARGDDRTRESIEQERTKRGRSDARQPAGRQQPAPEVTPGERERSVPGGKPSGQQPRERQEVRTPVPGHLSTRELQPAVKESSRELQLRPEAPKDDQRPGSRQRE
ncbi:MAG: hypothetical protein H6Q28_1302, partial [Bacteroidetes bacterium]|nr:hypothetical protein [Bacteroidota bacterium]